jgi:hypothetical protein
MGPIVMRDIGQKDLLYHLRHQTTSISRWVQMQLATSSRVGRHCAGVIVARLGASDVFSTERYTNKSLLTGGDF